MSFPRKKVARVEQVRALVDLAFANRYENEATMLKLSSRAVALAEEWREEMPANLMVAAWTQYGNALRISGRFSESERALERAASFPATDPATRIHCLEVTSSLYRSTKRFESAVRLLTSAIEAYRSLGDADGESRAFNLLGIVHFDRGDLPKALHAYRNSLALLGPNTTVEFIASVTINMVESLIANDRLTAAALALKRLDPFFSTLTSSRLRAKAEWKRAQLFRKRKEFDAARHSYAQAWELLSTVPRLPELPDLAREMAELAELTQPQP